MPTPASSRRFPTPKRKAAPHAAPEGPGRRVPTQDRSRQRVERILDAAARTFAETGYEAATTEAIAERAGTSIGSVYQFFPNKRALFDAIARRYLDRSRALFDGLMSAESVALPWFDLLDLAIDAFANLDRGDFDLRAVWVNWHLSSGFYSEGQALNREFAKRAEAVLSTQSRLSPAKRALVATIIVEVMSAMLFLAARSDEARATEVVAETKLLLRRYLEPLVKPATARRARVRA